MADRDWPQEIKSVQLANFRPTASERHALRDVRRVSRGIATRTGMSQEHLNHLRRMCCSVCSIASNLHAHSLRHGPAAGRAADCWTIPLCQFHCDDVRRTGGRFEAEWFARFGINAIELAAVNALVRHGLTRREAEEQYDTGFRR